MDWNTAAALRALCGAGLIAGAVGAAMAHGDATGVVADRMNGMMNMARSIKQLTEAIDSGSVEPPVVEQAAQTIRRHAGETMVALFPEDSLDAPSEASPAIWEDWQRFVELANRLDELGGELERVSVAPVPGGDEATPASTPAPTPGGIWASLDERALLGLAPRPTAQPEPAASVPGPASLTATLGAITGTCAQCHEAFRQARQ